MDDPQLVRFFQVFDHRRQKLDAFLLAKPPLRANHAALQRLALNVLHGDVGGLVFVEDLPYVDHMAEPAQSGGLSGLLEKAFPALLHPLRVFAGAPQDDPALRRRAHGCAARKVFLDADRLLQTQVKADVSNPKAALPEGAAGNIFSVQHCPAGQHMARLLLRIFRIIGIVIPAVRADRTGSRKLPVFSN